MQSDSNCSVPGNIEDSAQIDFSPMLQRKLSKEAIWFTPKTRKSNNSLGRTNISGKPVKQADTPSKRWGHSSIIYKNLMIIFGGRHSQRSLANLYALNLNNLTWSKIEPLGQTPPARDSHSSILVR